MKRIERERPMRRSRHVATSMHLWEPSRQLSGRSKNLSRAARRTERLFKFKQTSSDHLQIILVRQLGEFCSRQRLIPERDRRHVILLRQIAPAAAPTERLNGDAQVFLEAHRVHDVPAVESEARLRSRQSV